MPVDYRSLRPFEAVRLLNSMGDEPVATERDIRRVLDSAGARVCAKGDLARVDIVKLTAWLAMQRHRRLAEERTRDAAAGASPQLTGYEAQKERSRARQMELSRSGRDIGELPAVVDQVRKDRCRDSFQHFCREYFPALFCWSWSLDHLRVIEKLERSIRYGGLFAIAMPRGSGKSAICRAACMWALLYGHRRFVVLIGANEKHAGRELDSIKMHLETNELLLADFPEVCFPIRAMEGITQRASGQLYHGCPTYMSWTSEGVVLPTIEGSAASSGVIRVAGLTGQLRGMSHTTADGLTIRPDLVVVDDPQTDDSARSPSQCAERERLISGAVLGLAGPATKISGIATVTVIQKDDLADSLLKPERHPQWQGERCRMILEFPTDRDLWDEYAKVRKAAFGTGNVETVCNAFYRDHRKKLDAGAAVAWEERIEPPDLSALHTAMNLLIDRGEEIFWAEYQNDPGALADLADEALKAEDLAGKLSMLERGVAPFGTQAITAFIDVQERALFWMVCAFGEGMNGSVIDYGTWPDQRLAYFTLRQVKKTMQRGAPGQPLEAAVYAGLEQCIEHLMGRVWRVDEGGEMRASRGLIDAGYGKLSDLVYQVCRASPHAASLFPSKGVGITALKAPINEWAKTAGDRVGLNWKIPAMTGRRQFRHVIFDTNWWKSCMLARLKTGKGAAGAMYLFGDRADQHRMLIDHLLSERPTPVSGPSRTVDQWELVTVGRDNHWWDCLVGCAVAASQLGIHPPGIDGMGIRRRKVKVPQSRRRSA